MGQRKLHYKMYKDGKKWIFAGIATISVGIGLTSIDTTAHADAITNQEKGLINGVATSESAETSSATAVKSSNTSKVASEATAITSSTSEASSATAAESSSASEASSETAAKSSSASEASSDTAAKSSNASEASSETAAKSSSASEASSDTAAKSSNASEASSETAAKSSNASEASSETAVKSSNASEASSETAAKSSSASEANSETVAKSSSASEASSETVAKSSSASEASSETAAKSSNASEASSETVAKSSSASEASSETAVKSSSALETTGNKSTKEINQTGKVTDPDYPDGMWLDTEKDHYSFSSVLSQNKGREIVLSTNRSGDGIIYVYLINKRNNSVLQKETLQRNSSIKLSNGVRVFNDDYTGLIQGGNYRWSRVYDTGSYVPEKLYNNLTFLVPEKVTQKVTYVDEQGNDIVDENGQIISSVVQTGLTAQKYTTDGPKVVNGYYVVSPENASGTMSQFGVPGKQYVRNYHDGYKTIFTEIDGQGAMNVKIYNSAGRIVHEINHLAKGEVIENAYHEPWGGSSITVANPYVDQTRNVRYEYHKLGSLVPDVPGVDPVPYPNDPKDPTKPGEPVIPDVPGYTPEDPDGNPLKPGDTYPVDPTKPGADTPLHYKAHDQQATVTYVDETTGKTITVKRLTGKSDTKSAYRTQDKINELINQGYEFVSDTYPADGVVFDHDDQIDQAYKVTLKHKTTTVTPENPGKPDQPIDPENPKGPKYPAGTDYDSLHHDVHQTVHYVDEAGHTVFADVTDQVSFDRTGTIDEVTGEVTYTDWQAAQGDNTFDAKVTPVKDGYYADQASVPAQTVTADSADQTATVVYHQLGSLVPDVPGVDPVPYPNDPTDPTKPGEPIIPDVPGYTPVDPSGKPVTPGDGYPVDPTKPGDDTPLHYEANEQHATVNYVDATTGQTIKVDQLTGASDTTSDYRTNQSIQDLVNQGYELVSDNYPADGVVFDHDDAANQDYTVTLKHKTTTVTPEEPGKPGEPIDPENPDGPKYPVDTDYAALHHTVNQTVQYVDEAGNEVFAPVTDQVNFDRTGVIDEVTGEVTYTDWQAENDDNVFDAKPTPVKDGYYADQASVPAQTVTADSADQTATVVYHQLGSLVPDVPGVDPVPYPNDPTDPTKPGEPIIPDVPGYTPVDPSGKPVTPGDGYPVDPTKPGDDTPLHYEANEQHATVNYVDATTGQTIKVDQLTGASDTTSDYRTNQSIQDLVNQGYELVSDNYPADGVVFDHDDAANQDYTVTLQHKTTTVTPEEPGKPGEPIDPENPDGPKYPVDTDYAALHHTVNQTVQYVDEAGNEVFAPVTDQVNFDRTGVIDEVTGEVTYTDWQAENDDNVFDAKPTPVKDGYYADQASVPAQTVTADSADQTATVVYHQLGSLVPDVPGVDPVPYPNDPTDPTKPGEPIIPDVPGYTPVDPSGKPVTPGDGYPVDPTKPGDDTPLHYEANEQHATVNYVDATTGQTIKVDQLTGASDTTSDYRTNQSIQDLVNQGYELVSDNYPADGVVFDHDDAANQDYTVTLQHKTTTVTPEEPGKPGEPIDPENPDGPKYPVDTDYAALHHTVNQTVQYVDEAGNEVFAPVTDQVNFDRTGVIDEVTGEVTYTDWQAENDDNVFDAKPTPVKDGYYADQASVPAQTVTADSADQTATVVYHQLGSLVPDVPGVDPVPYPNDPTDPTKPGEPIIPDVPGYTPVDPSGKPVTPGDGYPVDPTKPGDDTPLHYEANEQHATVNYVDATTGQTIKVDQLTGASDTTSDYRTNQSIQDLVNQGYELVSDNYPADGVVFDHDDAANQDYTVTLQHKTTTVTPEEPGKPGEPIDPENPDGPKYPVDTDYAALHHTVNQTVQYVDEAGNEVFAPVTDQVNFDRTGVIDEVTGEVTYTDWQAENDDNVFDAKPTPVKDGYYADQASVPAQTVTADSADQTATVVYHQLGSLVPDVPGVDPVPYPNDPTDPTKPGEPIIPDVPGYTPVDPSGKPVTPGDGYPVDPTKPGDDTPLHYEANEQHATVNYVDATTGQTIKVDQLTGASDTTSDYRTNQSIQDLVNQGYELVSDNYPADGVVFDHDDAANQEYTVTLQHKTTTVTPEEPGQPGEPIDPDNPDGPKYPGDTDIDTDKVIQQNSNGESTVVSEVKNVDEQTVNLVPSQKNSNDTTTVVNNEPALPQTGINAKQNNAKTIGMTLLATFSVVLGLFGLGVKKESNDKKH